MRRAHKQQTMSKSATSRRRTLPCLPIFIAGCREMLVLAGAAYSSRLWTAVELFVLVSIHREKAAQKLVLIPLDPTSDRARVFGGFDIRTARCTRPDDRHALLAVIEASFGDLDAFNRVLRTRLIDVERQHADARVAVGE